MALCFSKMWRVKKTPPVKSIIIAKKSVKLRTSELKMPVLNKIAPIIIKTTPAGINIEKSSELFIFASRRSAEVSLMPVKNSHILSIKRRARLGCFNFSKANAKNSAEDGCEE